MGITSLSNVVSPLIFGPLSALFLADDAPFNFPGFSMLSVGLAYVRPRFANARRVYIYDV